MNPFVLLRRLLPRGERGDAVLGDWLEVHAAWREARGPRAAALLLVVDVARSLPSLAITAVVERGTAAILRRSIPAVAVGVLLSALPLVLGGTVSVPVGESGRLLLMTAGALILTAGASWTAAVLAGAAPLLHGVISGAAMLMLLVFVQGCAERAAAPPVVLTFLSGEANDWEPTLAVGPAGAVTVMAARRMGAEGGGFGESAIVTWHSTDGGASFGPAEVHEKGGGDERVVADSTGRLHATWIRLERDSAGEFDLDRGGLVYAVSEDRGTSWRTRIVANIASGVADKPELTVSRDGRDVHIAFMGRGTLDVLSSYDSGAAWERHIADSTYTGHWPSGIALTTSGALWIANVRHAGSPGDSVLRVAVELHGTDDGGRAWRTHRLRNSTRWVRPDRCLRGASCPVQIPLASIAADDAGTLHVVHAHGDAGAPYALEFMRSDDGGSTWSAPHRIGDITHASGAGAADVFYPMIAADGDGLVYVAWFDDRDGVIHVRAARSMDGGRSWSPDVRLSPDQGLSGIYGEYGGIGIDAQGRVHVTWSDGSGHISRGGHGGTWYARWDGRE